MTSRSSSARQVGWRSVGLALTIPAPSWSTRDSCGQATCWWCPWITAAAMSTGGRRRRRIPWRTWPMRRRVPTAGAGWRCG